MKYQLKEFNRNIPEDDLLTDLKNAANKLSKNSISSREYDDVGKYSSKTIIARFETWNNALIKVGLELVHQREVSNEDLFKNLEQVWINVGCQPVFRDMKKPNSKFSTHQYISRFGNWRNALEAFIEYINSDKVEDEEILIEQIAVEQIIKHKTKRNPSDRLKVQVLMRDGNKCKLCGITVIGQEIHFDHIHPWSKGGETTLDNLQILCAPHNLAKGNVEYET